MLNSPRNYSVAILFNIIHENFPCVECSNADKAFRLLAKTWGKAKDKAANAKTTLFFVNIDYIERGKDAFSMVFQAFITASHRWPSNRHHILFFLRRHQGPTSKKTSSNTRKFIPLRHHPLIDIWIYIPCTP